MTKSASRGGCFASLFVLGIGIAFGVGLLPWLGIRGALAMGCGLAVLGVIGYVWETR